MFILLSFLLVAQAHVDKAKQSLSSLFKEQGTVGRPQKEEQQQENDIQKAVRRIREKVELLNRVTPVVKDFSKKKTVDFARPLINQFNHAISKYRRTAETTTQKVISNHYLQVWQWAANKGLNPIDDLKLKELPEEKRKFFVEVTFPNRKRLTRLPERKPKRQRNPKSSSAEEEPQIAAAAAGQAVQQHSDHIPEAEREIEIENDNENANSMDCDSPESAIKNLYNSQD